MKSILGSAWSAVFTWAAILVALAVALQPATLVLPVSRHESTTPSPSQQLVVSHGYAGMEDDDQEYDRTAATDDEDEDFWAADTSHGPRYAANSHNAGHNTRGAARQQQQQQQLGVTTPAPPAPQPSNTNSLESQQPQQQPGQQQQQQQQPSPPAPSVGLSGVCTAVISRGARKGQVCSNKVGSRVPGFCCHHDGKQKRRKATSGAAVRVGGENEGGNYDSEDELGGGVDELQIPGADPASAKARAAHYKKASTIADPDFKRAQESVWHLKKKQPPKPKPGQPPAPSTLPVPDDDMGWKLGGLPQDVESEAHKRRHKHRGGDKFSLSVGLLARLPKLCKAGLDVLRDFVLGQNTKLPFKFFEEAFPTECQDIILDETNKYVNFCADECDPPPQHQDERHRKKKVTSGFESVPWTEGEEEGSRVYAFEREQLYGVMGILIVAGITQKRRLVDHWGTGAHDDYLLVRACMTRDMFMLFYSRFFHMAPTTGKLNKDDADFDCKHHIRKLEDALNKCWSALVEPGAWLSYDEQMVKSTARAMFALMRFNKCKPIKHGIKGWAICCPSGYCFVQSIDGGFSGDIKLRPHDVCPLGRSARTVLYVLLEACPTFSGKIIGSGVTVAMDNFFTGAALLRCLASRDIFVVGTLRGNRTGLDGANELWEAKGMTATNRGETLMARSGELVIIRWIDSQPVHLMTTKHIFEDDWAPLLYTKRAAQNNGEAVSSVQPRARQEYVKNMGGVDVADQRLSAHAHVHKPMTYFWRRVFDQKFAQAISNAYLLFAEWASVLATQCTAALEAATEDGGVGDAGDAFEEEGLVGDGCDLTASELQEFQDLLKKTIKMERVKWDRKLATHLMSLSAEGSVSKGCGVSKGARRKAKVVDSYLVKGARSSRLCRGGVCAKGPEDKYSGARTRGVCWCNTCTNMQGKARALSLCVRCQKVPEAHTTAANAVNTYTPIAWTEVSP